MGRVFSYADIVSGRFPNLCDFDKLGRELQFQIKHFDPITDAVFLGSYVSGGYSIRSDFDCIVIYDLNYEDAVIEFINSLHAIANSFKIPLKLKPIDNLSALSGVHSMQTVYLDHIIRCIKRGGNVKGDVIGMFRRPNRSKEEEALDYLIHKIDFFSIGWSEISILSSEKLFYLLSKALEFPVHIARKMCEIYGCDFSNDDSKKQVIKEYPRVFDDELKNVFLDLVNLDRAYSRELERQIEISDDDPERYTLAIRRIKYAIPKILDFARKNADLLLSLEDVS